MKNIKHLKMYSCLCLLFFAGLGVAGALSLKNLQTQYSVMQFLPGHHPALQMDQAVRDRFHIVDRPTFIGLISLEDKQSWFEKNNIDQLALLTNKIKALAGVNNAVSLANVEGAANVDGALSVGTLISLTPEKMWRQRFLDDKLLSPALISANTQTTLLYVQLNDASVNLLVSFQKQFRGLLKESFPQASSRIGGVPAVQTDLGLLLNKEMTNFLFLTILACMVTLALLFRTLSTMLIPLLLTAFCNLMVFAMMAWTGLAFTILSATIPILVFIAVVSISAHILLRVHEDGLHAKPGEAKWDLILRANRAIWLPNLLGALTTCTGFLTLLFSDVPLIRHFGIAVAAAILISWLLTSILILPLLVLFPLPQPRPWIQKPARWALWIMHYRKGIVLSVLAGCLIFTLLGQNLQWTGRLFDDLPEGQEARQSTELIDQSMGGVVPLELVIRTPSGQDWNEPKMIAKLDGLVNDLRTLKGIGSADSIPDFLRVSGVANTLPTKRAALAEVYFLFSLAGHSPLQQYLTDDARSARVEMKIHDLPANEVQALLLDIQAKARAEFQNSEVAIGGMGAVVHLIHDEISHDLIFGFWQALGIILVFLACVFGSLRWALVACIPNLVPPIALLGYLALTNTPIKPGVAIIFSIALGLAFNNTVYILNRLKALSRPDRILPVAKTFYLEGNPCLVSTLIVMMGFSVFLFSYFSLNRTFGACMLISIIGGLIGDLVFLPAMLRIRPSLLKK